MSAEVEKKTTEKRRVGDGTPGPGRPKGVPNKTTIAVKEALSLAFDKLGGVDALVTWAKGEPTEFYKLYTKLLPVEVKGEVNVNLAVAEALDAARKRLGAK